MMINPMTSSVLALIAGVLILVFPAILNYVIGVYLLIAGILGIIAHL